MQETVDSLHLPKARMKTIRTTPTTMAFLLSSSLGGGGVEGDVVVMLGFGVAGGEGDVVVMLGFRVAGGEGDVVVMLGFRLAGGEGVTEGEVVVEETTTSDGGGGILGDDTGVSASVDVNIVVAALVCYTDTTTYDNGMVRMPYYDLPILRLIIGAEVDKVLRVCKFSVTLSDISRPHSVGFGSPIAYSVFMSSLVRSSL